MLILLVSLGGLIIGSISCAIWAKTTGSLKLSSDIKGYHFHHSLFSIPVLSAAIFFSGLTSLFFFGLGMGVIIQHSSTEGGFKFITKS